MKINLGCGRLKIDGYVGVDCAASDAVDIVADACDLPFEDGTIDEIYSRHMIEHLPPLAWPGALAHWVRLLKRGGRLVLECPDLKKVAEYYAADFAGRRPWWKHCIYGDPHNGGAHLNGFSLPDLVRDVRAAGLEVEIARTWHDYDEPKGWYNLRVEAVKP